MIGKTKIFLGFLAIIVVANYYFFGFEKGTKYAISAFMYTLQFFTMFLLIYQTIISYLGFLKKYKKPELKPPKKRFALIVAAHNEEAVIGNIVKSLMNMNYPKKLYDIYVICDNCTDKTAEIVRAEGAIAMERLVGEKRGKGYALEWMFEKLWEMEKEGKVYDAVAMFDADNVVDKNFLMVMNTKLLEGYEVVQGYLDTKNPNDTWITKSYAFAYWSTNRVFQLARENLGLSAQIGGTGVVIATNILKEIGWGATSLTEDLEFTQRYILRTGKRVAWAHEAKIYDEKPMNLKASWRQRVRWMQGHSDCMTRYSWKLIKEFVKKRKFIYFDTLIYLISPGKTVLTIILGFLTLLSLMDIIVAPSHHLKYKIVDTLLNSTMEFWFYLLAFVVIYSVPFLGVIAEKKGKSVLWAPLVFIFSLTWLPITLIGFLKRKEKVWTHTKHIRDIKIEDLEKKV